MVAVDELDKLSVSAARLAKYDPIRALIGGGYFGTRCFWTK